MENSVPPVSAAIMSATARTRPFSVPSTVVRLAEVTASTSLFSSAVKYAIKMFPASVGADISGVSAGAEAAL